MKLLICGGGTGGHVYPALAVVDALRAKGIEADRIGWIGTEGQMEETLVPRAGIALKTIPGGPIVGVPRGTQLRHAALLLRAVGSAWRYLGRFRPNVLLLTGGYVNLPVALAARARGIPAAVYLPDVEPGAAIKVLRPLVARVACTADASQAYFRPGQTVVTGYPVRAELREALAQTPAAARAAFGLAPDRPTVFVFGGSRGAQSINRALMSILPTLLQEAQVIHISGTLTWPEVEANRSTLPVDLRARYHAAPYLHEEMGLAFRAADIIVARAGASMLGEGPAFGVPAILVPYPYAWRYQKVNADYLADRGAALRLDDERLQDELGPLLARLLRDPARLAQMAHAAHALDRPRAAAEIANLLLRLAGSHTTEPVHDRASV